MAEFAIFEMSDGTTTINFLQGTTPGFHLNDWKPQVAQAKGGGTFQSSSLSVGRRLVDRKFANIIDSLDLKINNLSQNQLIFEIQEAFRLLEKATQYWTTDWQNDPVWIKAQAKCEDNPRYTLIVNYQWEELDNPYSQPFYTPMQLSVMDNITLVLEHKHWLCNQPGTSTCQELTSQRDWNYDEEWENKTMPVGITGRPTVFLRAANDYLFAYAETDILRSIDNGENWIINTTLPAGIDNGRTLIQLSNGDILAGDNGNGDIYRTQDNGGAWANIGTVTDPPVGTGIWSMLQLSNGDILASYGGGGSFNAKVDVSVDGGVNWTNRATLPGFDNRFQDMILLSNGDILAAAAGTNPDWTAVYRSTDSGITWEITYELRINQQSVTGLTQLSNGDIFFSGAGVANDNAVIYKSEDNGETFEFLYDFVNFYDSPTNLIVANKSIFEDGNLLYAVLAPGGADPNKIVVSDDRGQSWRQEIDEGGGQITGIIKAANGTLLAISRTGLQIIGKNPTTTQVGADETCTNSLFLANKENITNLTHIKIDDGGVFTDIMPIAAFPQELLPTVPANNDAIYFGVDPNIVMTDGVFSNLVFDIDTPTYPGIAASDQLEWEYYNGAWVALTVTDRTHGLSVTGPNSVSWVTPSDWTTVAIDGITAYWVRLRNDSFTPIPAPTQQNRQIYTNSWSNAQIEAADILGDIPALFRAKIFNTSDIDGRGGDTPDLWSNRLIVGLRSTLRGSKFQAFLNASDTMLDERVIIALGTNVSFSTDITTPTGRKAVYNPAGVEAMADRVRFIFPQNIIDDFYGSFHAFLRVQRIAGASTDLDIQLKVINGSGGIEFITESKQVQGTTAWELLDFGRITMPVGGRRIIGDSSEIVVQASAVSGTPNLEIYDLVLIPVDEWAGDFVDFANSDDSIIGVTPDLAHSKYLDIDSLTDFKTSISSVVRRGDGSDFMSSHYNAISPGEAILQANAQQRLWVLSARTSATGSSFQWLSEPWVLHSIQAFKNERYLGLRGER